MRDASLSPFQPVSLFKNAAFSNWVVEESGRPYLETQSVTSPPIIFEKVPRTAGRELWQLCICLHEFERAVFCVQRGFFLSPLPHNVSHRNTGFVSWTSWVTVDCNCRSLERCGRAFVIKHSPTPRLHALLVVLASSTWPPEYHLPFRRAISTHRFKKLFHHLERWNATCKQPSRKMDSRDIKQCETGSCLLSEGDHSTQGR